MYEYWMTWPFFGIVWAIFWIVVSRYGWRNREHRFGAPLEKSALDILKDRYAKGEIGKAEFDEKKKDIL